MAHDANVVTIPAEALVLNGAQETVYVFDGSNSMRGVIESTAGMYGDLKGIAVKGLNDIEGLQIAMLSDGEEC